MLVLRASLYYTVLIVSVLFYALFSMTLYLVPFKYRYALVVRWPQFAAWAVGKICGLKYTVQGLDNIPEYPVVIASKHQSAWETLAFQKMFVKPTWVLKRELLWLPFFGWGLRLLRPVAIDRSSGRQAMQQVIDQGTVLLKEGHSIIIFPEGTRVAPGAHKRYGLGAANLAIAAGVPILPVAHNAGEFWRRNEFIKRPGTIQVIIGEPIPTQGKTATQLTKEIETWIEQQMVQLNPQRYTTADAAAAA